MTLVCLQYPAVPALAALCAVLAVLTVRLRRGTALLSALTALCAVALVLYALACAVPYSELLPLLLLPTLACALALGKGGGG